MMNASIRSTWFATEKSVADRIRKAIGLADSAPVNLDIRHGETLVDGGGYYICVQCRYEFPFDNFNMTVFNLVTEKILPSLFFGDMWASAEITDRDYFDSDNWLKASYYLKPKFA